MKTYEHVYDILSKSPDFVTGESLAKSLGVSRTAIWKAIQTLQEQGIDITSVRKKGYYLEKGDILLPQDISKQLNIPVYFNPDSNSTQLDAKHGMEKNNPTPALYLASSQKAAKGRFERHFFASPQGGIYMSRHLKPNCHSAYLPPYTMMAAAAIVKAIQRLTGINTEIKWVNDIYLNIGETLLKPRRKDICRVFVGFLTVKYGYKRAVEFLDKTACNSVCGVYKVILHKGYFAVLHAEVLTLLDFLSAEHAVTCGKRDLSRMNALGCLRQNQMVFLA